MKSLLLFERIIMDIKRIQTDVLIIGGGTAGCYAALTLYEKAPQLNVLICEKANI